MNEKIQNYIEKRKEAYFLQQEKEKHLLLERLNLGERVYANDTKVSSDFPLFDCRKGKGAYGIDSAKCLTNDEYEELKKLSKPTHKMVTVEPMSALGGFAIFMMILIPLLCILPFGFSLSEREVFTYIFIGILAFNLIIGLGVWSTVYLLAKNERNTRKR